MDQKDQQSIQDIKNMLEQLFKGKYTIVETEKRQKEIRDMGMLLDVIHEREKYTMDNGQAIAYASLAAKRLNMFDMVHPDVLEGVMLQLFDQYTGQEAIDKWNKSPVRGDRT